LRSRRLWEIREKVLGVLEELSEELGADVYLFGSYARGDHRPDSDVDVLVVSERFEGMAYVDRVAFVGSKLPYDMGFEIVALTPGEFEKGGPFIREVSRYWIRVGGKSGGAVNKRAPGAGTS
jgi:predicted nucleotidyltransferase